MATLRFGVTVPSLPAGHETAALGVDANNKLTDKDINKAVKLAANNNYVVAADGNDFEGVLRGVEPATVNNGFSHGTVQVRFQACEAQNTGSAIAVGATVVCAAQSAIGTEQDFPKVKAGAGVLFKWRVKSLLKGTGQTGETILIEPITR